MSLLKKTFNSDYVKNHTEIVVLVMLLYMLGFLSGFMFLIFLFVGSYTIIDLGLRPGDALLLNSLLSIIFFLQHSIMVRKGFKNWLRKFMPDIYHGAFYGITSAMTLLLVLILWQKSPVTIARADGIIFWLLRTIFLLCMFGFFWGARALGSFDALGVSPLMNYLGNRYEKTQEIIVKGPYRWLRHPLYFFLIIIFWVCPVLTLDRLMFNILWSIWIIIGTVLEDRDLHREFGGPYSEYSSKVPMIIPYRIPRK
jgi:methanethiol S-methyltransferase